MHIDERDTPVGKQWHSLTVPEIERIKELFVFAGYKPPKHLGEMVLEHIIYDRIGAFLQDYAGPWDYAGIMQVVAVACEVENQ